MAESMGVKTVQVFRLNGHFNHSLDLFNDQPFSILYGPNGVGKTKILELLHALYNFSINQIAQIPFSSAIIIFSDQTLLSAVNDYFERGARDEPTLEFQLSLPGESLISWTSAPRQPTSDELEEAIANNLDHLRPLGDDRWRDTLSGRIIRTDSVLDLYGNDLPAEMRGFADVPPQAREFLESLDVHLIETQRLLRSDRAIRDPRTVPAHAPGGRRVAQYARDLATQISRVMSENSRVSQSLDRSFPGRVLRGTQKVPQITDDAIYRKYDEQLAFRSRLAELDLVDDALDIALPSHDLSPWDRAFLWLYLEDADKKLAPFRDLVRKLDLLEGIINSRFLLKQMVFSSDRGYSFVDSNQSQLNPTSLSSGEQHELVMFYDLLFNVTPGTLVLIDEPEISLHVSWQQRFMRDIAEIAAVTDTRYIIATHSPQVINKWSEQAIELGPFEHEED